MGEDSEKEEEESTVLDGELVMAEISSASVTWMEFSWTCLGGARVGAGGVDWMACSCPCDV